MSSEKSTIKPQVTLVGTDGNVFSVLAIVRRALLKAELKHKADEFIKRAMACHSYDEVLQIVHEYVTCN